MEIYERLRQARKRAGFKSASAAARHYGWKVQTYISHENGFRDPHRAIVDYAAAYGVPIDWLRKGGDDLVNPTNDKVALAPPTMPAVVAQTQSIPILARVGAGSFFEADYDHMDEPIGRTQAPKDIRFPDAKYVAFRVVGDSMDLARIHDGDIIHCIDWADAGLIPITGMIVVVEERKFGGQAFALTVKQVEVRRDEVALMPRSSNPAHKPIVIPKSQDPDEAREVRIVAVVYNINIPVPF